MKISESELRRVVRFVLEKNSCGKSNVIFENYSSYYSDILLKEEILKEINLKHQLLPILLALVPLVPGCNVKDVKAGNVPHKAVAMAQVINNKIPKEHQPVVIKKILDSHEANKRCTRRYVLTVNSTLNAKTGEFKFNTDGGKAEWEEVCEEIPAAEKLVKIATSPKAMEKAVDDSSSEKEVNNIQKTIIMPQLKKDQKDGTCKVIDGKIFYTPFCYGGDVESADLSDAIEVGESPSAETLNQENTEDLNEFLEVLEDFIKSSEKEWEWNRELIRTGIESESKVEYDGLDLNKIDQLHNDWLKTKSNQKEINDYINGPAADSFVKGIMKSELGNKKSMKDKETLKSLGLL